MSARKPTAPAGSKIVCTHFSITFHRGMRIHFSVRLVEGDRVNTDAPGKRIDDALFGEIVQRMLAARS